MANKSFNPRKRHSSEGITKSEHKRNRVEPRSRLKINGSMLQKKTPRLSPALFRDDCEIRHKQIHELLRYAALGKEYNAPQASWCHIHHQKHLKGVVVVLFQELSQLYFYKFYMHFRHLRRLFKHRFRLPPPPSDFISSLVGTDRAAPTNTMTQNSDSYHGCSPGLADLPGASAIAAKVLSLHPIIQKYGVQKQGLTRYLLTAEELTSQDYPLTGSLDTAHFVSSGCVAQVTDSSPLFGLDCEMCLTDKGSELTWISLVDADGQCIMDELVKPDNIILNYMTRFSGITKEILLPVKTKLKDVQERIKTLLPPDAVLVGHSLCKDLQALQMIHTNVIDTSLLFAGEFGRRFRLKFLAQVVLGREIQCEDVLGHNPSEDAKATLNLAQYFILHGPTKVAQLNLDGIFRTMNRPNGTMPLQEDTASIPLDQVLHLKNMIPRKSALPAKEASLLESLHSSGRKVTYISKLDSSAIKDARIADQPFHHIQCISDEEVLERACSVVPASPFSVLEFCHMKMSSESIEQMKAKVKAKFADMMTVFAGPFKKNVCIKTVKRVFLCCGPIHSLGVVSETFQPFICVKYCVLEAAQLALESLNETCVDGSHIKVQRLLTQKTLECEDLIREMEDDQENEGVLYVSGFREPLTEEFLQQEFSHLQDIKAILLPKNETVRKPARHCYLKFGSMQSAVQAAEHIREHGELRSRKALTASHLHRWLEEMETSVPLEQFPFPERISQGKNLEALVKNVDRKIKRLFKTFERNTLCLVLFPGKNSASGPLPGFGFMAIKEGS
uniref:RNA exonuclease 5 n=1 Tax=Leptobrachium leishanense TaxID=445787 RepID=A0A8C5QSB6_9ANUR